MRSISEHLVPMRFIPTASLLAAALATATPAQAWDSQQFCDSMREIVVGSIDEFRGIRSSTASEYIDDDPYYLALRTLPDSTLCIVSSGKIAVLSCRFFTGNLPNAERVYEDLQFQVERCLSEHTQNEATPEKDTINTTVYISDVGGEITIDKSDQFGEYVEVRFGQVHY